MNFGFNQQTFPQQNPYQQQGQFQYNQQQAQFGMIGGYQQPQGVYGNPYQQPMMQGQMGMGFNQNLGFGQTPQFQQPMSNYINYIDQFSQQQAWNQNISLTTPVQQPPAQQNFGGISLQTTTTTKKK
jgi:hypothetical protein